MRRTKIHLALLTALLFSANLFAQPELTFKSKGMFTGSGNCAFCHEAWFDALQIKGKDVSPATQWRSTMMANATKDPLWKAKVESELSSIKNDNLRKTAGDFCLKCHAPMGFTQASVDGDRDYTVKKASDDLFALDGVSCTVCHQIESSNLGHSSSLGGNYIIGKNRMIWGPYKEPLKQPMINHERYEPEYSEHMNKSELCATCHTVITPFVNDKEEVKGVFFEQTPYLEWKNSMYPENDIRCQSCHMPSTDDGVDIASRPPFDTKLRKPYWFHQFVGANTTMQKIFIDNVYDLGLSSLPKYYEDKLKETSDNLLENSLGLSVKTDLSNNELTINVKLENQTGHKLPTGIPFRRMWIHLTVSDNTGNTVFESGKYNEKGEIEGQQEKYSRHYDRITDPGEVQIYEGIMADVNANQTYALIKAAQYLKDNRIPPAGFTTKHQSYDSAKIYGEALGDPDFNKDGESEGTGSDITKYIIKNASAEGYRIQVEVCYQSVNPAVIKYFEKFSSPNVKEFLLMYNKADKKPFIIKTLNLDIKS